MKLNAHELALLSQAIPYAQDIKKSEDRLPTQEEYRRHLHCSNVSANSIRNYIADNDIAKLAERMEKSHDKSTARALTQVATDAPYTSTEEYLIRKNALLTRSLAKMKQDLNAESKMRQHLSLNHAGYDELLANVKDFVQTLGDFSSPVSVVAPAKPKAMPPVDKEHSEDAVLVISDTHFGDVIRCDDTSGFPEYDLEIAGNRMGYIARKAKQVLGMHRAMYPIKKLYIPILGDIGNGVLHDSPHSNSLFIPAQIHFSYHMLRFLIEDCLTMVDQGIIEEIVLLFSVGNHMRMDIHMPHKHQAQRTFDWLIYQFIIEKFRSDKRVTIHDTMSPFIFENIRGHRYLFNHGMQVGYVNKPEGQAKSVSSFIANVRALFDSPEYRHMTGLEGETFSRAVIGDIHIPVSFPRLMSNGSLNGQNELGTNWTLEPIPAGMQLFGVSDKHQSTWHYFLDCTHVQRENPNDYAKFALAYDDKFGR